MSKDKPVTVLVECIHCGGKFSVAPGRLLGQITSAKKAIASAENGKRAAEAKKARQA